MDNPKPRPERKEWMEPTRYTDEPERSFQSTDRKPMDYSRGPHDRVLGEEIDDEDDLDAPPQAPSDQA